jgi:glycosyltransferase involved in cell wall biosynthesis
VTSDRGQMAEIIDHGKNGLLVSDDPEDILEKLLMLKNDVQLRKSLAYGAWSTINNGRSWKDNVQATLTIFEKNLH